MSVKVEFREDRKRWQVTYFIEGKRKRPLFREKREADNFARKLHLGMLEKSETITIAEASKQYFERISIRKNPKSRSNDKRYLNLHEHFMFVERGIERIGSVQLEDLEAFRDWLLIQREYDFKPMRMGPSSVNRCLRVLKNFYRRHCMWKTIGENPSGYLEMLTTVEKERPAMSAEQFVKAHEACTGWLKDCVEMTFLTGIPPTCIERLEWTDVDLPGRKYFIMRKKGAKAQWRRIQLGMSEATFILLAKLRNAVAEDVGPVFRDERGCKLLADRISRAANEAIRAAGVKGVTFYGLRHALASDMTAAGIAMEIVRQAMGHQSIVTTQRYANKVELKVVSGALDSVRGGKVVAVGE